MKNLGRTFAPMGFGSRDETKPAGAAHGAQEAIKVISTRLPTILGARSLAPKEILGARPMASPDPQALVLKALLAVEGGGGMTAGGGAMSGGADAPARVASTPMGGAPSLEAFIQKITQGGGGTPPAPAPVFVPGADAPSGDAPTYADPSADIAPSPDRRERRESPSPSKTPRWS